MRPTFDLHCLLLTLIYKFVESVSLKYLRVIQYFQVFDSETLIQIFLADGQKYLVGFYKHVDVYSVADCSIEFSIKLNGRSNDVAFLDDNTFALAGEMPHIGKSKLHP